MFCFMICQMCPTGRPAQHPNSSSVNYSTIYHKIDAVCGLGFITDGVFPKVQADSSPSYHHPFKWALARGDPHHRWLKSVPVHDSRSFTGCCRHSLLHFSRYLLCICWLQFEPKNLSLDSSSRNFQSISCVFWHTSSFSPCFSLFLIFLKEKSAVEFLLGLKLLLSATQFAWFF